MHGDGGGGGGRVVVVGVIAAASSAAIVVGGRVMVRSGGRVVCVVVVGLVTSRPSVVVVVMEVVELVGVDPPAQTESEGGISADVVDVVGVIVFLGGEAEGRGVGGVGRVVILEGAVERGVAAVLTHLW